MFCPFCGTPNSDDAAQCVKCGHNFQSGAINPLPPVDAVSEVATPPISIPAAPAAAPPAQPVSSLQPAWQEQPRPSPAAAPPQWAPQPQPPGQMPPGRGNDAFGALIPYKNSSALIAYYLAVFALIPCFGLLLGIAAFILGLKGLKFAKQHPEAKGVAHAWVGIILGGFCALVNILVPIVIAMSSR